MSRNSCPLCQKLRHLSAHGLFTQRRRVEGLLGGDRVEPLQAGRHDSRTELFPLIHDPPSRRRSSDNAL